MEGEAVLVPIICSLGFFALVGIIWVSSLQLSRTREKLENEVRLRLLDRSAPDPAVAAEWVATESRLRARSDVLRSIRGGSVLLVVGAAFCYLSHYEDDSGFLIPGILCLGAGAGYAIAAAISLWLCNRWNALAG